jgi:chitin disaccharide deacetylase
MTAIMNHYTVSAVSPSRRLIVNADDFGLTGGVNAGIIAAHEHGIVTSASLMVRWPAAVEAARYAAAHPSFSLGLHLDLGEWRFAGDAWQPLYEVVPLDEAPAVTTEVRRQLAQFHELVGAEPTHLDSHQHVHRSGPAHSAVMEMAAAIGVPVRSFTPEIQYCGGFYGQDGKGELWPEGISCDGLLRLLEGLPLGITELGCHPGLDDDLNSMYARERRQEVVVLCDPRVAAAIKRLGIELISYANVLRR